MNLFIGSHIYESISRPSVQNFKAFYSIFGCAMAEKGETDDVTSMKSILGISYHRPSKIQFLES